MRQLSTATFIGRRIADDWKLLLSIFLGILVATTLVAGAPIYVDTLERQSLNTAIDRSPGRALNILVFASHVPVDRANLERIGLSLEEAVERRASHIYRGQELHLKAPTYLVGLPERPLSETGGVAPPRGYFQSLSNLKDHVTFVEGRMARDDVSEGDSGPVVETMLGSALAGAFGLGVGDTLTLTPSPGEPTRISAEIVGILDATDPAEEYWRGNPKTFIEPTTMEGTPLALFITREAMIEAVGGSYRGTMAQSTWYLYVDRERLKDWSVSETNSNVDALEKDASRAVSGSIVLTGIKSLLRDFERRSFFSTVPLLLLLTVMVITVLYYLGMMVSYLVQSREGDVALLRSRGIGTLRLLRFYALEGLALTVVAVFVAPFLAMGAIALAGKLAYFREITGGAMLPVEFQWTPFVVAAAVGLLSLAIFVVPGVVGARSGLVVHKLRSSRPPSVPFFQRYYLDIALLVIGGLVFWELHERGQLISGGLFENVQVNEALLLAPVLFLTVVALVFMRFFPMLVRYIGGDSPAIVHLAMAATVVTLVPATVVREHGGESELSWVVPVVLMAGFVGAYWATQRANGTWPLFTGLVVQSVLVGVVVAMEPPEAGEISFAPTLGLISIVPGQLLFRVFRASSELAPVWVSMGLWHMARNPLQYSWLVLLLLMVTGLGLLSTTVGETLDRSYEERILYDVAADIRVSEVPATFGRSPQQVKEAYAAIPGVTSASLAFRGTGNLGPVSIGGQFDVLAVEPRDFSSISWYREDFSDHSLPAVMRALEPDRRPEPLTIPEGATAIGVWIKPKVTFANMSLRMVLEDARGDIDSVSLGRLGEENWHLMRSELPADLELPARLVSLQVVEASFRGTAGSVLLDDIHVIQGIDGEEQLLEDFEVGAGWVALATSGLWNDTMALVGGDVFRGGGAALFTFGEESDSGVRGIVQTASGGAIPAVASSSFLSWTGFSVGDAIIVQVMGHPMPLAIRDTVHYFPTLNPHDSGFILVELDGLLRHLNLLSPQRTLSPNEVFVTEGSQMNGSVGDGVRALVSTPARVHDKQTLLESVRLDPLTTAGWRAMVVLSLGIVVITAGLGHVTHLLAFASRSRGELGLLRSLGLARRQLAALRLFEHLVIAAVALGLGTWAGLEMSGIMVSSVAVTETGRRVVPPFLLVTNWGLMLPIYGALAAMFVAALFSLMRGMLRPDFQAILRGDI